MVDIKQNDFFFWLMFLKDISCPCVLVNRAVPDPAAEHHAEDHLEDLERKKGTIRVKCDTSNIK